MTDVVVDTDIASYIFNQHRLAPYYVELLRERNLLLSFLSVAELRAGAFAANWSDRRRLELDEYIAEFHVVYSEATPAPIGLVSVPKPEGRVAV